MLIWNIRPVGGAQGYGLDVWGRIVGVSRTVALTTGHFFGFGEPGDRSPFGLAPFYSGIPVIETFTFDDETYRRLIFAEAALNITNCGIPAINTILRSIFPGRGNTYCIDGANGPTGIWFGFGEAQDRVPFGQGPFGDRAPQGGAMTITYVFDFVLTDEEIAIVINSGVLPKPTGVKPLWLYQS